jgi:hypothetical protein
MSECLSQAESADSSALSGSSSELCWQYRLTVHAYGCPVVGPGRGDLLRRLINSVTLDVARIYRANDASLVEVLDDSAARLPSDVDSLRVCYFQNRVLAGHFVERADEAHIDILSPLPLSIGRIGDLFQRLFMPKRLQIADHRWQL